jgi:predicted MPP superfamily phosphohydrolase
MPEFAEREHISSTDLLRLCERFGLKPAERRMRIQVEESAALFGPGRGGFHFENIHAVRLLLQAVLTLCGLARRAKNNCAAYRVECQEHVFAELPPEFDGYTILHLADLHSDALADGGDGIIRLVSELTYDLAVCTGDYRFETVGDYLPCMDATARIAASIRAPDGFFGVLGNHDFLEMIPYLERGGIRILLNEHAVIRRGAVSITLSGVDDPHFYGTHDLGKALDGWEQGSFAILLAHSPEIAAEAAALGVNLYLCGHTHGGQICFPGTIPIIANASCGMKLVRGKWLQTAMTGYTSRGTGFSTAAARFFCPPEITLHTLRTGSDGRQNQTR